MTDFFSQRKAQCTADKKLSCGRETARYVESLNISLSHSRSFPWEGRESLLVRYFTVCRTVSEIFSIK